MCNNFEAFAICQCAAEPSYVAHCKSHLTAYTYASTTSTCTLTAFGCFRMRYKHSGMYLVYILYVHIILVVKYIVILICMCEPQTFPLGNLTPTHPPTRIQTATSTHFTKAHPNIYTYIVRHAATCHCRNGHAYAFMIEEMLCECGPLRVGSR